ncbi:MAG: Na/Pi cotransporter family protein [Tissierellia bacterium]|nr:Na/Pi cotransporter family protein [Tissierellia bacterium]
MSYIIGLLGGLALFLFGMEEMSQGLELTAGDRLQSIIQKLTKNKIIGVLLGVVVTALVQSSSAVTVMMIGFVNSGIMTLPQAVSVIMGANIGTTITGQIVALNITDAAPVIAFIGFVLYAFIGKKTAKYIGQTMLGLGFLFMGLEFMSDSMAPLRENEAFISLLTKFDNPILAILAGTILTFVIQSSSASVGILQALANQGLIALTNSMYIIFGFNIGTCITSVLSSINASKNAKRTAASHVLFNVAGTIIFLIILQFIDIASFIEKISPSLPAAQLANVHTLFNLVTTVVLFPFANQIAKIANLIIRGEDPQREQMSLQFINKRNLDISLSVADLREEVRRMFELSKSNFKLATSIFFSYDEEKYEKIMDNERVINFLNTEITDYIIKSMDKIMDNTIANRYTSYLSIVRSIERIGDHTKSMAENAKYSAENSLSYTDESKREMSAIENTVMTMFQTILTKMPMTEKLKRIKYYEEKVDNYTKKYRIYHIERMKDHVCDPESGLIFEKLLTGMERVSDYIESVAKLRFE